MEDKISKTEPLIQSLIERYGVDDLEELGRKINADKDFLAEAAEKAGMTVDQYKQFTQLKHDNEVLRASQERAINQQQAEQQLRKWAEEGEQLANDLKDKYGIDFDINKEAENPEFAKLLQSGVSVKAAYTALHFDQLGSISNAKAVKATEKAVVDQIRANGSRPVEAGTSNGGGFTVKTDVDKFTKDDIDEILKRVDRGEQIIL